MKHFYEKYSSLSFKCGLEFLKDPSFISTQIIRADVENGLSVLSTFYVFCLFLVFNSLFSQLIKSIFTYRFVTVYIDF